MRYRIELAAGLLLFSLSVPAAQHAITVDNFGFHPDSLTIEVGDSVTWVNEQGFHNVNADDDSFRCANGCSGEGGNGNPAFDPWQFTRTFDEPGTITYHCQPHREDDHTGVIIVRAKDAQAQQANLGHTGSWFNPETDGQGFIIEIAPEVPGLEGPQMVVYWFTYADGAPGGVETHRWYQATGSIGFPSSVLDVFVVTRGVFDDPNPVDFRTGGTITVTFTSCTKGTIEYNLDLDGNGTVETQGLIPIQRLTPDVQCRELSGN